MIKEEFDNLQPGDYVKASYGFWGYVTMIDRVKNYYIVRGTDREELQFWHDGTLASQDDVPKNTNAGSSSGRGYDSYYDYHY